MFAIITLGQIYLASAILGSGFILFNFAIGQLGTSGHDFGAGDSSGGPSGHDFGAGDTSAGPSGHDFGAADSSAGPSGHDFSAGDTSAGPSGHDFSDGARLKLSSRLNIFSGQPGRQNVFRSGLGQFVLGFFSPMSIAISLAFFGLGGIACLSLTPWLGLLTLIPAIFVSLLISNSFKLSIKWMIKNMSSSSASRVCDLIGQLAEINIPIKPGKIGEIVYVVQNKRYNAAAKAIHPDLALGRGAKVLIVDMKDQLMVVEPIVDAELAEALKP